MTDEIKNKIFGFSVYNQYIRRDLIEQIARGLCETYGWSAEEIALTEGEDITKCKAWEYTVRAAIKKHDIYAIATLLFYKYYSPVIEETEYHTNNESLLCDLVEILEGAAEKDAFTYFLIGRANFAGRGAELDYEKAYDCFCKAADGGIEIARLFALEISESYDAVFPVAKALIKKYPDSHIVRYYLGYCYFRGYGTAVDHAKVTELFGYEGAEEYGEAPIDYYFLASRYLLGVCYFRGEGVEKDLRKAEKLFRASGAEYNPEAWYAEAITLLLSDKSKDPEYIWSLLKNSALRGCLPAARKVMLCLRTGYGTEPDKELYTAYADYYDYEKENGKTVSDLGYEADHCDLTDENNKVIKDDELD